MLTQEQLDFWMGIGAVWGVSVDQINAWFTTGQNGGTGGDGMVPFTNRGGITTMVPCLAKIVASFPTGQPADMMLTCFADTQLVRTRPIAAWVRTMRVRSVVDACASLWLPDQAAANTAGIVIDIKANDTSIFAPGHFLTILPGQTTSRSPGTPQPVIAVPLIPDDALLTVETLTEGAETARGLRVGIMSNYVEAA